MDEMVGLPLNTVKNPRGYSLLEMMITVGVITLVAALSGGFIVNMIRTTSDIQSSSNLSMLKREFARVLTDRDNWLATIEQTENTSSGTDCLTNADKSLRDCSGVTSAQPFVPFMANPAAATGGSIYMGYDPRVGTSGFTPEGAPCTTFNQVNPTERCFYRMEITWQPVCSGACIDPEVLVRLQFIVSDPMQQQAVLSARIAQKYSTSLRISHHVIQLLEVNGECPDRHAITGINADGSVVCESVTTLEAQM